jgi:hypothetical protein
VCLILGGIGDRIPKRAGVTNLLAKSGLLRESILVLENIQRLTTRPWALPGKQFHLAYSIEDWCMSLPVIPHDQRDKTVLLLADRSCELLQPDQ